jgi:type IX secretion system PorP/SprF family membrane protein
MKRICSQFRVCFLVVLSAASGALVAQDARFSQFFTTPHLVNPAFTSFFQGDYQVMLNYRNQWGSVMDNPYRTISLATGMKLYPKFAECDFAGLGFQVLADQAGSLQFGTVQASLSGAYYKALNGYGKSYLALGFSGGIVHRSLQVNPFTDFLDVPEAVPVSAFSYGDFNAGLLWSYQPSRNLNWYAGAAAYHLNRPDVSHFVHSRNLSGGREPLDMRYVVHTGGTLPLSPRFRLRPSLMAERQGPSMEIVAGGFVQFITSSEPVRGAAARPENALHLGAFFRPGDAAIVAARMDFEHYYLTLSYDVTASKLSQANRGAGGLEISVAKALFRAERPVCPSPVDCPLF